MKRFGSSLRYRLLFFGFLLGVLPVVSLGIITYHIAAGTVQEKTNEANQLVLDQTQFRIDQSMKTLNSAVFEVLGIARVESLLDRTYQNTYEDKRDFSDAVNAINQVRAEDLTFHTKIISLSAGWTLDNTGFITPTEEDLALRNQMLQEIRESSAHSYWTSDLENVYLVKQLPVFSQNPKGMIIVSFPLEEMARKLGDIRQLGSLLILNKHQAAVTGQTPFTPGADWSAIPAIQEMVHSGQLSGSVQGKVQGNDSTIVFRKSEYSGWSYLTVVNLDDLYHDSKQIAWYTLLIVTMIILVSILTIMLGSRSVYRPISQLSRFVLSSVGSVKQERDELALIGDGVRTLLSSQAIMKTQIQDHFVLRLLQEDVSSKELQKKQELFPQYVKWSTFAVAVIQIDTLEGTNYRDQDRELLMFALNNMVGEIIAEENRLPPVLTGRSQVTIIGTELQENLHFKRQLLDIGEQICDAVEQFLKLKITIGFSRFYMDWSQASKACREGLEVLKYRDRLEDAHMLFMDDISPAMVGTANYPKELEVDLREAILLAQRERVEELTSRFVHTVFARGMKPFEYRFMLLRLLISIYQWIQDENIQVEGNYGDWLEHLNELGTKADVEKWLRGIIDPIVTELEQRLHSQFISISEDVKRMIYQEYDSELTLDVIASRLNYHPKYIGTVFKNETGIPFSEYLSGYRVQIAKQWLVETDLKISQIAERLKYNNPGNFVRFFRKEVGMTPGQYREQYSSRA